MVSVAHYCAASQSDSLAGTARPAGWMFFLPPATRFSRRSPHRRPPLPAQPPTARLSRGSSHDATFRMSAAELTAFGSGSKRFSSSCSTSSTGFPRPPPPCQVPARQTARWRRRFEYPPLRIHHPTLPCALRHYADSASCQEKCGRVGARAGSRQRRANRAAPGAAAQAWRRSRCRTATCGPASAQVPPL